MASKKTIIISTFIIIMALGSSYLIIIKSRTQTNSDKIGPKSPLPSVSGVRNSVLGDNIDFPRVASRTGVNSLPPVFNIFKINGATNLRISKVNYINGKQGYTDSFEVGRSMENVFSEYSLKFNSNQDWQVVYAAHNNALSVIDLKTFNYQSRIVFYPKGNGKVDIDIYIVTLP